MEKFDLFFTLLMSFITLLMLLQFLPTKMLKQGFQSLILYASGIFVFILSDKGALLNALAILLASAGGLFMVARVRTLTVFHQMDHLTKN
ncbi:hypothetical protein OLMES_5603 [Oleiphilus messinensis]|uniref:Uncharacterized protein n=1 Tax=Oleiphilus messinensis TaxID=141451 RepID=A0A1Y0IGG4_9GAMM|nr:hypothetical protein [Oleiphilus messinensis]ARU59582.1 hypothetical protein OLMES_5603 [Oleiphilus messinensis]